MVGRDGHTFSIQTFDRHVEQFELIHHDGQIYVDFGEGWWLVPPDAQFGNDPMRSYRIDRLLVAASESELAFKGRDVVRYRQCDVYTYPVSLEARRDYAERVRPGAATQIQWDRHDAEICVGTDDGFVRRIDVQLSGVIAQKDHYRFTIYAEFWDFNDPNIRIVPPDHASPMPDWAIRRP